MGNLAYFIPRQHLTEERKMIIKFLPKNKEEAYKADLAEKMLTEEQYFYYLALILIHKLYDWIPRRHRTYIKNLIDLGILDELAASTYPELSHCYVSSEGKFIYEGVEVDLPMGYKPRLRWIEGDCIFVEAFNSRGKRRVYEFVYYKTNGKQTWQRVSDEGIPLEELID